MKKDSIRIKSSPDKEYNPFGIPALVEKADDAGAPLWTQLIKEKRSNILCNFTARVP